MSLRTIFSSSGEPGQDLIAQQRDSRKVEEVPNKMKKTNDSGQALIETAISLSVFLILVMGTMDFGHMFSTKVTIQNAVRQAGRYAITGQCIQGSNGCSENRYQSILTTAENASLGILTASDITITCTNNGGGCPSLAGGPGDIVTIKATYPYHFMTGPIGAFFTNGMYTLTESASFTNEAFPPSQS
jgi:Flp pilus assembly protein TadG